MKLIGYTTQRYALLLLCNTMALWQRNMKEFGLCQTQIKEDEQQLESLQTISQYKKMVVEEFQFQRDLDEWLLWLEMIWRPRSHDSWLPYGDWNIKNFHATVVANRRKNYIPASKNDNESSSWTYYDIGELFQDKFT